MILPRPQANGTHAFAHRDPNAPQPRSAHTFAPALSVTPQAMDTIDRPRTARRAAPQQLMRRDQLPDKPLQIVSLIIFGLGLLSVVWMTSRKYLNRRRSRLHSNSEPVAMAVQAPMTPRQRDKMRAGPSHPRTPPQTPIQSPSVDEAGPSHQAAAPPALPARGHLHLGD